MTLSIGFVAEKFGEPEDYACHKKKV